MNIGLTQRILYHKGRAYDALEHGWYSYLRHHALYFIPNRINLDFNKLADNLDVLFITGGDDSALRRAVELKLCSSMILQKKPILGICHGCFLLQDVLGGSVGEVFNHLDTEHFIDYHGQQIKVNSHHSLAITNLHSSGRTLAVDFDGHPEAWIDDTLAGVVWHPERMSTPWLPDEIQKLINI